MTEGENLSKHAAAASQRALEMAGIQAADIDLILLATSTPDDLFGSAGQVSIAWTQDSQTAWRTMQILQYNVC